MSTNHSKEVLDKRAGKAPANSSFDDSELSTSTVPSPNDNTTQHSARQSREGSSFRQRLQHSMQSLWHSTTGQTGQDSAGQGSTILSTYGELGENKQALSHSRQGTSHVLNTEHVDWRDRQETTPALLASTSSHNDNAASITRVDSTWREQTRSTPSTSTNADWKQWSNGQDEYPINITSAWHIPIHSTLQLTRHEFTNQLPDIINDNMSDYLHNNDDGTEVVAFLQQPHYTEQIEENQEPALTLINDDDHHQMNQEVAGLPIAWIQSFKKRWRQQQQQQQSTMQCYLSPTERYLAQLLESTTTLTQTGYKPSMDIVAYLEQHTYTDDIYNDDLLPIAVRQGEQALRQLLLNLDANEKTASELSQNHPTNLQHEERDDQQRSQAIERLRLLQRHLMA